jgi:hypothetical protein
VPRDSKSDWTLLLIDGDPDHVRGKQVLACQVGIGHLRMSCVAKQLSCRSLYCGQRCQIRILGQAQAIQMR